MRRCCTPASCPAPRRRAVSAERSVALATLLDRISWVEVAGDRELDVTSIAIESRTVRGGALFVALHGSHTDGHAHLAEAIANGARVVVVKEAPSPAPAHVTVVRVSDTRRALSALAAAFYGDPSRDLAVIGITGTNGKTTAAHMIAAVLNEAGRPCGIAGTIGAEFGAQRRRLDNTTPLPPALHELLAQMRDEGAKAVAIEVSSHALELGRVDDVHFRIAVLTNVARDHLDFHQTREAYAQAKRRLFALAPASVLNVDDSYGHRWALELGRDGREVVSYGIAGGAMLVPEGIASGPTGSRFSVDGQQYELRLPGRFNVWNALAALGVARLLGIGDATSARGLAGIERVAGRMERIVGNGIAVVVDYAHTPDALENVLRSLRDTTDGSLAVVFGCGGDRDRGKRPEMGAVAAQLGDRLYVTNDNPRTEDPQEIVDAILAGMRDCQPIVELDRRRAIERAIGEAHVGDVVLIAGKGHERHQIVGDRVLPFDDAAVAREALSSPRVLR